MIRTQIQITEEQARALKLLATHQGVSVAELIRSSIDNLLRSGGQVNYKGRLEKAIAVTGIFNYGPADLAESHDDYLAEAYRS